MNKKSLSIVAALACASLLNSCDFIRREFGERKQTEITLISKTECNIDTVMNKPNYSKGREWVIQNTGTEDLCIDSVIPSSDCVELIFPCGTQNVKEEYYAHWTSYENGEMKEHNISKNIQMTLPRDTEPGKYLAIRAMLHPAEKEEGPFSYSIMVYGNFPDSPLELTLEGDYVIAD